MWLLVPHHASTKAMCNDLQWVAEVCSIFVGFLVVFYAYAHIVSIVWLLCGNCVNIIKFSFIFLVIGFSLILEFFVCLGIHIWYVCGCFCAATITMRGASFHPHAFIHSIRGEYIYLDTMSPKQWKCLDLYLHMVTSPICSFRRF